MKFQCDHCGTRYTLSDAKIRNKVLKIRCKVCENIMVVRDPAAARRREPVPVLQTPPPADLDEQTQLSAGLGAGFDAEWYVASAGMQTGPMPVERLIADLRKGAVKPDDLVWNATMDDWLPAEAVPILAPGVRGATVAPAPPAMPAMAPEDEEATVIQNAPNLFDLQATAKRGEDRLAQEVSAAVDAIHPVDDETDTTAWPNVEPSAPAAPVAPPPSMPSAPVPPAPKAESSAPPPIVPPAPEPDLAGPTSVAPAIPDVALTDAPAAPATTPVEPPAQPAAAEAAGDTWMTSLHDHLEEAPVVEQAYQIHAITKNAPPKKRPVGLIALVVLLLVAGLAVVLWPGSDPAPAAPDQGATLTAVVDAAVPAPAVDAAKPPVDAAVPDAAKPDAAPIAAAKAPKQRKAPSSKGSAKSKRSAKAPKPDAGKARPKPTKTKKPASGLAALDQGKGATKVKLQPTTAPVEILPETLTKSQLQAVLTRGRTGVQACYQRQLKRDPSMRGAKATVKFKVQRNGRPSDVRMNQALRGTVLRTCLVGLVKRWRFPRFTGEPIPVEYPLFFQRAM